MRVVAKWARLAGGDVVVIPGDDLLIATRFGPCCASALEVPVRTAKRRGS